MSQEIEPNDVHRLTIRADQPAGWAAKVELDGRPLMCSEVNISLSSTGTIKATITLPTVLLDMDTNAVTPIIGAFRLKEPA